MLVVGAGPQAERKVGAVLETGAKVRVVAPAATPGIDAMAKGGSVDWQARAFVDADVDGAWLVVAATSEPEVQRAIATSCATRNVFCIAVDDPANASAYSGSVIRRAPFTIAISSTGEAPGLTRLLREVLEGALPPEEWVARARTLRRKWKAERTPMGDRFAELVKGLTKS